MRVGIALNLQLPCAVAIPASCQRARRMRAAALWQLYALLDRSQLHTPVVVLQGLPGSLVQVRMRARR